MTCTNADCIEGRIIRVDDRGKTWVDDCECRRLRWLTAHQGERGFQTYDGPPRLADFDPGKCPRQKAAAGMARLWLDQWTPGVGAYIWGRTGAGKTRFATALVNELYLRTGHYPRMISVLAHVPDTSYDSGEWRETYRQAARSRLLVLDNLRDDITGFRLGEVARLVEAFNRTRRTVVVTSTQDPATLRGAGAWGDIASRLCELAGVWNFQLGGDDLRRVPTTDRRTMAAGGGR